MQAFELTQLISQQASSNDLYFEFLRVPDLSTGLYVLCSFNQNSKTLKMIGANSSRL